MSLKKSLLEKAIKPAEKLLSLSSRLNAELLVRAKPIKTIKSKHGNMILNVNNPLLYYRAKSFFTKEPDTLAWIDSFEKNDVFFDIGANIGLYSMYAGLKGVETFSFEPESQNYAELNRNLHANNLGEKVHAFCVACSDTNISDTLYLSQFGTGQALHNFGEESNFNGESMQAAYKQPSLSYSLDELIEKYKLPTPMHIKIDVDGIEEKVVSGARKTLKKETTQSVLIEINENRDSDNRIVDLLLGLGFDLSSRYHAAIFDGGDYADIYNYVFSRKELKLVVN